MSRETPYTIRPITPADDTCVASVIRTVMPEFGADGPGFAIHDPEVDHMSAAYPGGRAQYLVIARAGEGAVAGGGGFAPLAGGDTHVCELRKMYFLPELRGKGLGGILLDRLLRAAREAGFRRCYLETLHGMDRACALYESRGFSRIDGPLGSTGHFGCNRFYVLDL